MKSNVKLTKNLKTLVSPSPGLKNLKSNSTDKKVKDEEKEINQATKGLEKHNKKSDLIKSNPTKKRSLKGMPKVSAYAKCLLSPFEFHASQIPDSVTFPSACLNLTYKGSLKATQVVGSGLGYSFAICIGSTYQLLTPYYMGGDLVPTRGVDISNGFLFGSTCTGLASSSSYMFGSGSSVIQKLSSTVWGDFSSSNVQLARIVCASVRCTLTGPVLMRSGTLVGSSFPRQGISDGGSLGGVTYDRLLNSPNTVTVNAVECSIQSNYSPTDNVSYEYQDPSNVFTADGARAWRNCRGEIWIVGTGLQPDESIDYQVTLGIEFIPSNSILDLVDATPSFSHSNEMDQAENLTAVVPKVFGVDYDESWGSATEEGNMEQKLPSSLTKFLNKNPITDEKSRTRNVNEIINVHESSKGTGVGKFLENLHTDYRSGKSLLKEILLDAKSLWSQFSL